MSIVLMLPFLDLELDLLTTADIAERVRAVVLRQGHGCVDDLGTEVLLRVGLLHLLLETTK